MTQGRIAQIVNNANFCKINNLLSLGHNMDYIAKHYNMDPPPPPCLGLTIRRKDRSG